MRLALSRGGGSFCSSWVHSRSTCWLQHLQSQFECAKGEILIKCNCNIWTTKYRKAQAFHLV
jgi:hypothetical protein